MIPNTLPQSLLDNPRLDQWIGFDPGGVVRACSGKVEIGQGIVTALAQIVAEELDVPLDAVQLASGDTDAAPDERYTAGSLSIEVSGTSLRLVCAEVRTLFLSRLAERLGCPPAELSIAEGAFFRGGAETGADYWTLAADVDLRRPATGAAPSKRASDYRLIGTSPRRRDLPAKVFAAPFLHDRHFPGALHARVLRQPGKDARLVSLDEAAIRRAARGEIDVFRRENFVAFLSEDEAASARAVAAASSHAVWAGVPRFSAAEQEAAWLRGRPSIDRLVGAEPQTRSGRVYAATYSRPYQAHASLGPSCAVAEFRGEKLTVWTHGQGPHPVRWALARTLGLDPAAIIVKHAPGPGVYGHNGADDAAMDAALMALARPGKPIRVQWTRADEFGFEPFTPAALIALSAELDRTGRPVDWTAEIWSGTHRGRPGPPHGANFLAREALADPPPGPEPGDVPDAMGGGAIRNALPLYDVGPSRIIHHLIPDTPIRTSAMRGLGALGNVFAVEGFIDELAEAAGQDPLAYRLALLTDARAIRVLQTVARMADWHRRGPAGSGRGLGMGFARYKGRSTYAAVIAEVDTAEAVRLVHLWCAADAGVIVNPDGARNQLEGGMIHAASLTLKEQVRLGEAGVASLDWDSYPILRFSEIPELDIELIANPDDPSSGMGEPAVGPTAGAIGNAVAHALGARVRDLPLNRERIMAALLAGAE